MSEHRFDGRRVTVVGSFDSFLRAASRFAAVLEAEGATVEHAVVFARVGQVTRQQLADFELADRRVRTTTLDALVTPALADVDLVVLALDGRRTRQFFAHLHRTFPAGGARKRPAVVVLYPGLVFRMHLEGFTSRMAADLLMLNSEVDVDIFRGALASMRLEDTTSVSAGLSFLPPRQPPRAPDPTKPILFIGQPTVPVGGDERRYVIERLVEIARRHPEVEVWLKPRHRRHETTLHRVDDHYEDLLEERRDRPANLKVLYRPMAELLEETGVALTFSSTAALEALRLGVPTRVLTDVGVHENVGNHFFVGSGTAASFDDVEPGLAFALDEAWADVHLVGLVDRVDAVLDRVDDLLRRRDASATSLPPPYPRLFGRAPALDRYLERTVGWRGATELGVRPTSLRGRARRWLRPLRAAATRLFRR